jgi:hypothetical protein
VVEVEVDGKLYRGRYQVDRGTITLSTQDGRRKATQVGNSPTEALARNLLREIIRDGE